MDVEKVNEILDKIVKTRMEMDGYLTQIREIVNGKDITPLKTNNVGLEKNINGILEEVFNRGDVIKTKTGSLMIPFDFITAKAPNWANQLKKYSQENKNKPWMRVGKHIYWWWRGRDNQEFISRK